MKYCGRCGETIRDGEEYTEHHIDSATGPGATVYRHMRLCKRPPTQTGHAGRW